MTKDLLLVMASVRTLSQIKQTIVQMCQRKDNAKKESPFGFVEAGWMNISFVIDK